MAIVLFLLVILLAITAAGTQGPRVTVDWNQCDITRNTAASVLVAADPEWIAPGVLAPTAMSGVRQLAEAGADNLRLLDFNIFPFESCAQLQEGVWNFTLLDQVVVPFLDAALSSNRNNRSRAIVDIETSPAWMWRDAGACVLQSANARSFMKANKHEVQKKDTHQALTAKLHV